MKIQSTRWWTKGFAVCGAFALAATVLVSAAHAEPTQNASNRRDNTMSSSRTRVSIDINIGSNSRYSRGYYNNNYGNGYYNNPYNNCAPRYGNTVVVVPGYGYPYGYPSGGNVIVIGNGTTVINNGGYGYGNGGYGYGYPYGTVITTPQFYNYNLGGITPVYPNRNGVTSYNGAPASTYYFDPSQNANANYDSDWNRWDAEYNAGYASFGANTGSLRRSNARTTRVAANTATSSDDKTNSTAGKAANVLDTAATAKPANAAVVDPDTQWGNGAQWSANEDGTVATVPTWPSDTK